MSENDHSELTPIMGRRLAKYVREEYAATKKILEEKFGAGVIDANLTDTSQGLFIRLNLKFPPTFSGLGRYLEAEVKGYNDVGPDFVAVFHLVLWRFAIEDFVEAPDDSCCCMKLRHYLLAYQHLEATLPLAQAYKWLPHLPKPDWCRQTAFLQPAFHTLFDGVEPDTPEMIAKRKEAERRLLLEPAE